MSRLAHHDEASQRFVLDLDGSVAYVAYQWIDPETVEMYSTYVPPALRGRGTGARVVDQALSWAQERGLKVVPSCWFVRDVIARRPDLEDLVIRR